MRGRIRRIRIVTPTYPAITSITKAHNENLSYAKISGFDDMAVGS